MKLVPRIFSVFIFVFSLSCEVPYSCEAQVRPPNIVVIVADDMGYGDIGIHGSKDIPTPNIDSLARRGIRFTDAYVSGPYCSPTRAGLLTGRYPQRFGHEFNIIDVRGLQENAGLPVTEVTMADRLKAAGYRTAIFGKWHLGSASQFHPLERGFEEFFGFLGGMHSYMATTSANSDLLVDGRNPVPPKTYLTDALADRAVEYIKRQRSQPFFLYLAFNAVHLPMQTTEQYLTRFANIADPQRRTYAAMLSAMDDGIGKTLAALHEENLEENTLIFFFSDNGGPTIYGGINGSSNAPLKGSKRTTWEGGIRVPFIITWKGHVAEGKTYSQPIIQLDVLPTALAAAKIKVQPEWKLDGVNLLPFLAGKSSKSPHQMLFWRTGGMMAIRKGDWKLLRSTELGPQEDPEVLNVLSGLELYDLKNDIGETKDLASKYPQKIKELTDAWQQWNKDLAKPAWPPAPVRVASPVRP